METHQIWPVVVALALGAVVQITAAWFTTRAAAHDRLAPTYWAGIRTRATRRSPETWRAAHRAALPLLHRLVLPSVALGLAALLALAVTAAASLVLAIAAFVLSTAVVIVAGVRAEVTARAIAPPGP